MIKRLILLASLCLTVSANAEVVLVRAGEQSGQGWFFRHPETGECMAVTAAHVVEGTSSPVILTRDQKEGVAVEVWRPSMTDDVAVLRITGPAAARGCLSTLGPRTMSASLSKNLIGNIEFIAEEGDRVFIPVDIIAENAVDPTLIAFRTRSTSDEVSQGFSGAPIVKDATSELAAGRVGTPVAMIIEVAPNLAVRFDRIHALVMSRRPQKQETPKPGTLSSYSVSHWQGQTMTTDCPPGRALQMDGCGWRALPEKGGSVSLTVKSMEVTARTLKQVGFTASLPNGEAGKAYIEVSPDTDGDNWTFVRTCPVSASATPCTFAPVAAYRIRVSLKVSGPVELRVTEIR
ncbi:MAG: hypothetical protein QM667_14220 [Asticcacaulis sp.]